MVSPEEGGPSAVCRPRDRRRQISSIARSSCTTCRASGWVLILPSLPLTDLYSVSFGTADDGWAVGSYMNPTTDAVTSLVLHFTGGRWQVA